MNDLIKDIPRPLLVVVVLLAGIFLFFLIQKPHSVCDSQVEIFNESQKGFLYPTKGVKGNLPRLYERYLQSCKIGNSGGACYEYFNAFRRLHKNLNSADEKCVPVLLGQDITKAAVRDILELMVLIAWGDKPPQPGMDKFGWLETIDVNLFCTLKADYIKAFGEEEWNEYRRAIYKKLPGEIADFKDGKCTNCDHLKSASQTLSDEELWVRSLFSVRCEQF